jgi:hypothetical protein
MQIMRSSPDISGSRRINDVENGVVDLLENLRERGWILARTGLLQPPEVVGDPALVVY